ncbi:hypothetical protein E0765_02020 [Sulfuricurvum sp. IAE1]|jgi:hypothetical protein|uniref:hypothetical protein n=1 Tax=Sulfuricurvum sp. IAE1 TaxID=2546102 RepID=UPI001044A5E1|nr:hypothetical protein [Sulfuricurvum sp. IAE1]MDD3770110.1 hypothetical protein [Sulfuricurvum sp.]MDX9965644.1 hypothetical protein [Sulfuricurvum sp.]TDA69216.1 hypothetical protein E0765_02020 [Sulfuricurvum sp. IAE1]
MNGELWFEEGEKKIDLSRVTRLYPAAVVHAAGETASVSLEWAEMKSDVVRVESYVLVCDFDPVGEVPLNRVELRYGTKEELFTAMEKVSQILQGAAQTR